MARGQGAPVSDGGDSGAIGAGAEIMVETKVDPELCRSCGYLVSAVTGAFNEDAVPEEGDVTMCLNCGAPSQLRAGKWVAMTPGDVERLEPDMRAALCLAQESRRLVIREDLTARDRRS